MCTKNVNPKLSLTRKDVSVDRQPSVQLPTGMCLKAKLFDLGLGLEAQVLGLTAKAPCSLVNIPGC